MGSSSGESKSTSTQNLTPEQQSLVGMAMPNYQAFNASTPTLPGAAGVAGFTPAQQQGQQMTLNAAGQMEPVVNTAAGTNQYISSGAFLDPGSNPYVQGAVKAAADPIYQNLYEKEIPADQAQGAAGAGVNYGGSRQGIREGQAVQGADRAVGTAGANIMSNALQSGLQATNQAIGQAPASAAALGLPGQVTSAVGDVQQQQQQNVLNAENMKTQFEQWLPLIKAQLMAQGAAGLPGGSVSSVGETTKSAAPWEIAAGLMSAGGSLLGGGKKGGFF